MATGASNADLAVMLVDARKGVLTQTRRHSYHRLAARHPPRRAGGQQDRPGRIATARRSSGSSRTTAPSPSGSASHDVTAIPLSARSATTSSRAAQQMPWYRARRCSSIWRRSRSHRDRADKPFRLPVQWVNRPNLDFRGFSGTIASGRRASRATRSSSLPSGRTSKVKRIVTIDGDLQRSRGRRRRHADAGRRDRRRPRRRAGRRYRARPRSPTSSPRT